MPAKKSSKNKKGKGRTSDTATRELEYKQDMEEYGKVVKVLGDRKVMIRLPDGSETMGVIPGKMKKRCWVSVDNVVLVSYREYEADKLDVIYKYDDHEIVKLVQYHEIPETFGRPSSFLDDTVNTDTSGVIFSDFQGDDGDIDVDEI